MNTARWVDEEAAVREILTRLSKTVDDNRYICDNLFVQVTKTNISLTVDDY